jgi:hypothetical protein
VISEKLKSKVSSKIDEYLENRRRKKEIQNRSHQLGAQALARMT